MFSNDDVAPVTLDVLRQKADRARWYIRIVLAATVLFGVVTTSGFIANRVAIGEIESRLRLLEKAQAK